VIYVNDNVKSVSKLIEASGRSGLVFATMQTVTKQAPEELREILEYLVAEEEIVRINGTVPGSTATYVAREYAPLA
jgi:fructose-1-phosphate kinase PfkB-like protein